MKYISVVTLFFFLQVQHACGQNSTALERFFLYSFENMEYMVQHLNEDNHYKERNLDKFSKDSPYKERIPELKEFSSKARELRIRVKRLMDYMSKIEDTLAGSVDVAFSTNYLLGTSQRKGEVFSIMDSIQAHVDYVNKNFGGLGLAVEWKSTLQPFMLINEENSRLLFANTEPLISAYLIKQWEFYLLENERQLIFAISAEIGVTCIHY